MKTAILGKSKKVIQLNPSPIGSGGEGDVYTILNNDRFVAKIYKAGVMSPELSEKLNVMVQAPPKKEVLTQVAWPMDVLLDRSGKCCGFVMPKLNITHELGEIYKYPSNLPLSALQKINIAQNICVVISDVHEAGYVFGDFNPRNIGLDINTGLVSFLDTDTYHVYDAKKGITHRCNVCAPGYAAPELLEKCSNYISTNPADSKHAYARTPLPTFTKETDNFALAIHMFKLIMNGYTPFGGIIETASVSQSSPGVGDAAVRRDSYCFKPGFKHQSAAIMPLEALPHGIADLFTQAFLYGKIDPRQRPSAMQWYSELKASERTLVMCKLNPLHHYDRKNAFCPLCDADERYAEAIGVITSKSPNASPKQVVYSPNATYNPIKTPKYVTHAVNQPLNNSQSLSKILYFAAAFIALLIMGSYMFSVSLPQIFEYEPEIAMNNPQEAETGAVFRIEDIGEPLQVQMAIGDVMHFGNFSWRVLDVQENRALIITERVIDQRMYHPEFEAVTWETSEIRQFLNGEFFASFSPQDQGRIAETYVVSHDNPWDFSEWDGWVNTPGGNNTTDRIFLLSINEVLEHFGDSSLVASGATMRCSERFNNEPQWPDWGIYWSGAHDQHSEARIARDFEGSASWWWLRSPGVDPTYTALVDVLGELLLTGTSSNSFGGIRPALWLYLD